MGTIRPTPCNPSNARSANHQSPLQHQRLMREQWYPVFFAKRRCLDSAVQPQLPSPASFVGGLMQQLGQILEVADVLALRASWSGTGAAEDIAVADVAAIHEGPVRIAEQPAVWVVDAEVTGSEVEELQQRAREPLAMFQTAEAGGFPGFS